MWSFNINYNDNFRYSWNYIRFFYRCNNLTDVGISGVKRIWLGQPPTLVAAVWGQNFGAQADCRIVWGLDGRWTPTLGGLQGADIRAPHRPWQAYWGTASRGRKYLEETVSKVCVVGDGDICQWSLLDRETLRGIGIRDRGGNSCGTAPVASTRQGGVLGVSPHWRKKCFKRGETHRHTVGGAAQLAQWSAVCI